MAITTRQEYEEMVEGSRGCSYPLYLTTDGTNIDYEHHPGYTEFRFDGFVIRRLNSGDDWPSYTEINKCRQLAKKARFDRDAYDILSFYSEEEK